MPSLRPLGAAIRGQGGSTLVELLVAMPMAVLVLGIGLSMLGSAGADQARTAKRADALRVVQVGVERMVREIRQADWVWFRDSTRVQMVTRVRTAGATTATLRHVAYDCSQGECRRSEGAAVSFPPPPGAALADTGAVIPKLVDGHNGRVVSRLINADVFEPRRTDPASGLSRPDHLTPDSLWVRIRFDMRQRGLTQPVEVADAASLRNGTRFLG